MTEYFYRKRENGLIFCVIDKPIKPDINIGLTVHYQEINVWKIIYKSES